METGFKSEAQTAFGSLNKADFQQRRGTGVGTACKLTNSRSEQMGLSSCGWEF